MFDKPTREKARKKTKPVFTFVLYSSSNLLTYKSLSDIQHLL